MNMKRAAVACRRSTVPFTFNRYGEPTIRGVRVEIIVSRFRAGEGILSLADDYNMKIGEIEEAIRCGAR
jgi:uncharacterized protein (DUF433 family)